jgi:hypothetical protein
MKYATGLVLGLALILPGALWAQELAITNVQPDRAQVASSKDAGVQLRFAITAPAQVALRIYDGRDLQIRQVESRSVLPTGEHSLKWDLRDERGRWVPDEAYSYVLEARGKDGKTVRHDLTDLTAGATVAVRDAKWDAQSGKLSYVLDRPGRVSVRRGLNEGGPLLRTLLDWVARPAGLQQEQWDGRDASDVLDLGKHPRLVTSVQAFSLPENSILVGAATSKVTLIADLDAKTPRREKSSATPKRMYAHGQQPLDARGDFKVQLTMSNTLPRTDAGIPIVTSLTPVRLEVSELDRERALSRRFEPVFFVDGQFAFENEVGFVPMTWNFDPAALNEGEHFLTVNLRGYEGNFGMATVKVLVRRQAQANARN